MPHAERYRLGYANLEATTDETETEGRDSSGDRGSDTEERKR